MRKVFGLLLGTLFVMCMGNACDDVKDASENLCGPCGEVSAGDGFISGDARLDGIFKAIGSFGNATAAIEGSFKADMMALGEVFGLAEADMDGLEIGALVELVKGEIEAEIDANVSGSLEVVYQEPKCSASVSVAVEAQASCEASAGCEIDAECTAGEVSFECSGECTGGCSGDCDVAMTCAVEVGVSGVCEGKCEGSCQVKGPAVDCEGTCSGTCTVAAGVECSGTCDGNCTGTCDGTDVTDAFCDGVCEGDCSEECHISGSASCEGTCNGECDYTPPDGECSGTCKGECMVVAEGGVVCQGEMKCEGQCGGDCSGGCEGEITPPSCSVDGECSATAECEASASANASASLECTPPSLEIAFKMKASLDAQARAQFMARMEIFKVKMIGVIQGMFKMRALIDPNYAAELGIEPPVIAIFGEITALVSADIDSFNIPAGRLACVVPAFEASGEILGSAAIDLPVTLNAQFSIFGIITDAM